MIDSQNLVHREVCVNQGDILQLVHCLHHQLRFNHEEHVGRQVEALHWAVCSNQTEQLLDRPLSNMWAMILKSLANLRV